MTDLVLLITGWIVLINFVAVGMYFTDKAAAQNGQRRISDRNLRNIAWMGGSLGSIIGMKLARNKTRRKVYFGYMEMVFLVQVIILIVFIHPVLRSLLFKSVAAAMQSAGLS